MFDPAFRLPFIDGSIIGMLQKLPLSETGSDISTTDSRGELAITRRKQCLERLRKNIDTTAFCRPLRAREITVTSISQLSGNAD